jgi:hypothetical protein
MSEIAIGDRNFFFASRAQKRKIFWYYNITNCERQKEEGMRGKTKNITGNSNPRF